MENEILKIGKYKHFKGKEYRVICIAKNSETLEDMVVYEALYENQNSRFWVRPAAMFLEKVSVGDKKVSRFEFVSEK